MTSFTAVSTGFVLTVLLHGSGASALQQPPAAKLREGDVDSGALPRFNDQEKKKLATGTQE